MATTKEDSEVGFLESSKYIPKQLLGKGSDGEVWSCVEVESSKKVAVKKICISPGRPLRTMKTLREMQILRQLRHENVISLQDAMVSPDTNHVYLVQELMDLDLGHVFESPDFTISAPLCRNLLLQTLLGVRFIHSANVVHRDLKPENLLLSLSSKPPSLKVADFGHSCTLGRSKRMTKCVGTTRYKAPELLFGGSNQYTAAVDIWSIGCVFAQMLSGGRAPIFPSGTDTLTQINEIFRVLGTPMSLGFVDSERAKKYLNGLPYSRGVGLRRLYPEADASAIDLLAKMLQFDPRKRITAEEALRHRYFAGVYDSRCSHFRPPNGVVAFEVDDEDDADSVDENRLKEMIMEELSFTSTYQT